MVVEVHDPRKLLSGEAWIKARDLQRAALIPSPSDGIIEKKSKVLQSDLDALLMNVDVPFNLKLKEFVERIGRKGRDIYTSSNVNKKQYYTLLKDPYITPRKTTVLGLAVGLKLNITETKELLASAGYAFSPSSGADVIVEYCIRKGQYSYTSINLLLYENRFSESQIGTVPKEKRK